MTAMADVLVVGKHSGYGLTKSDALLAEALQGAHVGGQIEQAGNRSRALLDMILHRPRARTIVHMERVHPRWRSAGERHFLVPNQERFPHRHHGRLRWIDRVLAKTRHAEAIFRQTGADTVFMGFTSEDRRDLSVTRDWDAVLHLAGASTLKGTEDVLAVWAAHPEWPRLVLVQAAHLAPTQVPPNVELVTRYLKDGEVRVLQNRCGIHLCPSRAEGFGHHLVESLSTGALVVSTDAPPMNELLSGTSGLLVPYGRTEPRHMGTCFFVDPRALETAIAAALAMPEGEKGARGTRARQDFERLDAAFRGRLSSVFA